MDAALTRTARARPRGRTRRPDRGRPHGRSNVIHRRQEPPQRLRRQRTTYDYAGQDPINGYDLSGDCWPGTCWADHAAEAAWHYGTHHTVMVCGGISVSLVIHYSASGCVGGNLHSLGATGTIGGGTGYAAANAGLGLQTSNASRVADLGGPFHSNFGTVGPVSANTFSGQGCHKGHSKGHRVSGSEVSIGPGFPFDWGEQDTNTWTTGSC